MRNEDEDLKAFHYQQETSLHHIHNDCDTDTTSHSYNPPSSQSRQQYDVSQEALTDFDSYLAETANITKHSKRSIRFDDDRRNSSGRYYREEQPQKEQLTFHDDNMSSSYTNNSPMTNTSPLEIDRSINNNDNINIEDNQNHTTTNNPNEKHNDEEVDQEQQIRDTATEVVAFLVHVAIAFFTLLFLSAIVITLIMVSKYSFVITVILASLLLLTTITGYYVWKTLAEDSVLKPMQKKIKHWNKIATDMVVEEIRNFQLDMNELYLLGYDSSYEDNDNATTKDEGDGVETNSSKQDTSAKTTTDTGSSNTNRRKKRRARSVMFGLVIKPFLKRKEKKKKKKESKLNQQGGEGGLV